MAAGLQFDSVPYRALGIPSMLLFGERSTPGQKSVVAAVHAALPQSTVVALPAQAHAAQITAPDLLADALIRLHPWQAASRDCSVPAATASGAASSLPT